MKIQTRPWAIASGIGAVLQLVIGLGLAWGIDLFGPRLLARSSPGEIALFNLSVWSLQTCVCGAAYGLLVGGLYALALPRDEYFTATEGAFGGSVAAATASVSASALGLFIGLMFLVAQIGPQTGEPAELAALAFTQLFSGIGGLLVSGLVALMLGAAGGGVVLAVMRREK
jgi:hypothetical protein